MKWLKGHDPGAAAAVRAGYLCRRDGREGHYSDPSYDEPVVMSDLCVGSQDISAERSGCMSLGFSTIPDV